MTSIPQQTITPFPEASERLLPALGEAFDRLANESDADIDWQLRDGVLTIEINDRQWVINAHTPRQEIWLAGGGNAYHFQRDSEGVWQDSRGAGSLFRVLHDSLRQTGITQTLELPEACGKP